ncbi:MAG: UDP-2,3-diacylglucosamine diphosphatase LpxI [Thermodesulfobacteriota bacterium]|nr:UDP-2,3-diacylglucosamine diphosphatase LpxI [Thermodesulfobacteriota bacterium]
MEKIGLIAGNGQLPILFANALKERDISIIAVGFKGETLFSLKEHVEKMAWINIGQLQLLIETFKNEGIANVVMVGGITKALLFSDEKPDYRGASFLSSLKNKKDDIFLRSFAEELENDGINIESATKYIPSILAQKGCLTKRLPTEDEYRDIRFGWDIAKDIGKLDIGQTVIVKDQAVLAVEAIEGTDEAIKRAGKYGNGQIIVVKVSKPFQDMRFDIPVVGMGTVRSLKESRASALAIEAGRTIILDKDEMIKYADKAGISIVAI